MAHSLLAQLLGRYIHETRLSLGIKQSGLSSELGFSRQFMKQIEDGDVAIPKDVLAKCVHRLNLQPERMKLIYRLASEHELSEILEMSQRNGEQSKKNSVRGQGREV